MSFMKKTVRDVPLHNRTVLVRADYNVPLDKKTGKITDDNRIVQSLPTLRYLREQGCRIVLIAHLGRPDGAPNPAYSLEPVASRLGELLSCPVAFAADCIGDMPYQASKGMAAGDVLLLENLRFHPEEEANDDDFAREIARASRAEFFVQDGFGVVHRAHASTDAITRHLPGVAGLLLEREAATITAAMEAPTRPFVAILGGAKISDKIPVIKRFVDLADSILIGGAMANTFLQYHGWPIGTSLTEPGMEATIKEIYDAAEEKLTGTGRSVDDFIVLPRDVTVATSPDDTVRRTVVGLRDVTPDEMILDIGSQTIERFTARLADAKTVVWNGTMGLAEKETFAIGSARVALQLARSGQGGGLTSIIGGGDTADFVLHWDGQDGGSFTHVSTGGGASLELMAGEAMPGIVALLDS